MLPICSTVCKMVPEEKRKTTPTVLKVIDLTKLPAAKLRQIKDWLVATVASYAEKRDFYELNDRYVVSDDGTRLTVAPDFLDSLVPGNHNHIKVGLTVSWNPSSRLCAVQLHITHLLRKLHDSTQQNLTRTDDGDQTDNTLIALSVLSCVSCRLSPALQGILLTLVLACLSCSASSCLTAPVMSHPWGT